MMKSGKLYVVGIGPGDFEQMTGKAAAALKESQVIVGYTVYVELVRQAFPDKEMIATPMRTEVERCRSALEEAAKGRTVSMVCSGDAGIYGMAGPVLELSGEYPQVEISIVPGVTAACSGASLLGAPLGHDFAVISLSDLLTPMEQITKRLVMAAAADLVICLYNPGSRKRTDYLKQACELLLDYLNPDTVCGVVRNIGREEEYRELMSLLELKDYPADMFTTVFIGNTNTRRENGWMITPRGYRDV